MITVTAGVFVLVTVLQLHENVNYDIEVNWKLQHLQHGTSTVSKQN